MDSLKDKKKNIGALFDNIASHYDLLNHLLSFNIDKFWRKKAVKMLNNKKDNLLDVATGTCDLAIEIARQQKANKIMGIDLSEQMLTIGKEKIAKANLSNLIDIKQEDCTDLSFADCSFDAITCGFGVRNFSNLDKGLREMYRVLKPQSQIIIIEFSYPKNPIVKCLYDFYFSCILPFVGKIVSKDKKAYEYLPASVKHFIWGEEFVAHLKNAGFTNAKYKTMTLGVCTLYSAIKSKEEKIKTPF